MAINKNTTWEDRYRKLGKLERDQIRTRLLQGDDGREKIAREFKCSLKQIDGIRARLFHSDSWLS